MMKNSTANIGKRIREVRVQKKLTQNQLCGTELTRNHLSLIESGKALPSLKNICYIADRLDIPVGYFFSDDENEDARFINYLAIDEIKRAYIERDFQRCISLCEAIPENLRGDEVLMIYARSKLTASLAAAERLDISSAITSIRSALDAAEQCAYLSSDFIKAVKYYDTLFLSLTSTDIPTALCDVHEISSYVPSELVMYMNLLSGKIIDEVSFTSSRHRHHAEAIHLMRDGNMRQAFNLLLELSELSSLPYYMKFRVYDDLEKCANEIGEFKTAYTSAKRKLELLGK